MLINRQAGWIIITPPKTASTTLSKTFPQFYSGHQHDTTIPKDFVGTIYATVRDPFARAVSLWRHWLWDRCKAEKVEFPDKLTERNTFADFCEVLPQLGTFFYPMSWWTRQAGTVVPLRIEQLDEEVRTLGLLSPTAALPQLNKTRHAPFETYYTPDLQEHVRTLFSHDFHVFQYPASLPCSPVPPG